MLMILIPFFLMKELQKKGVKKANVRVFAIKQERYIYLLDLSSIEVMDMCVSKETKKGSYF